MAVCYFNADYSKKYDCTYEINADSVSVTVRYDIADEIEGVNGVKKIGANTRYQSRDILIVDYALKRNLVLKNAVYRGHNSIFGTPDSKITTKFFTHIFFEHSNPEKLAVLPQTPRVSKIRIYSKVITDWIGHPSVQITQTEEKQTINLLKTAGDVKIELNQNNIKTISISDNWVKQRTSNRIIIDLDGYIELGLRRKVKYDEVSEYVTELLIFLQLFCPDRMKVEQIEVMVDQVYFGFHFSMVEMASKDKYIPSVVDVPLPDFLEECYSKIPYRKSKEQIRNIPYIVLRTSRSIEDNFLMFYRFVECYYKKAHPETRKTFISRCIKEHHPQKNNLTDEDVEKLAHEIISLRNHYVHSGYFIKNSALKICFDKVDGRKNPKDYTVKNVDFDWIYDRTKVLHKIVIRIIYTCMLGYPEYNYGRHF